MNNIQLYTIFSRRKRTIKRAKMLESSTQNVTFRTNLAGPRLHQAGPRLHHGMLCIMASFNKENRVHLLMQRLGRCSFIEKKIV
jgi:hypothetical protein